ncbi:DUF998 domain-containing protein [Streptomyces cirratus]|uniref:DUF998 domain-containing protein n=1 Tax=Streptomyces cirratus TaxID=68187 RepID=UPI0036131C57
MIGCPHGIHVTEGGQVRVRIGYSAWIAGVVQFFVIHGIAQSAWARPYSWARNNISDLGNAHCALQPEPEARYICSPEHALMNASFVALGVLLVVGVVLTGGVLWRRGRPAAAARVLLAGAGVGFVLAGLAPADVNENQHVVGALFIMAAGNLGLVVAGVGLAEHVPLPAAGYQPAWSHSDHGLRAVPLPALPRPRHGRYGTGRPFPSPVLGAGRRCPWPRPSGRSYARGDAEPASQPHWLRALVRFRLGARATSRSDRASSDADPRPRRRGRPAPGRPGPSWRTGRPGHGGGPAVVRGDATPHPRWKPHRASSPLPDRVLHRLRRPPERCPGRPRGAGVEPGRDTR